MERLLTWAILGTSLSSTTYGRGWNRAVADRLLPGGRRIVRPTVFAIEGNDSAQGQLQAQRAAPLRPDVVTVEFATNDAIPQRGISFAQSKANLNAIIDLLLANNPAVKIFVMTMNPVVVSINPSLPDLAAYFQGYRDVAAQRGLPLIDNAATWGPATVQEIPDGTHPLMPAHLRVTVPNVAAALGPLVR